MQALNYIDADIPYLKDTDSVQFALDVMAGNAITELPVVKNWKYLGLVYEDFLLNVDDSSALLGSFEFENADVSVIDEQHVFELIRKMIETNVFTMPILNKEKRYIGISNAKSVLKKLGNTSSLTDPGGMVVLQMEKSDYALSEIARIVESNGALILNCYISSAENVSQIEVTLKISKSDLKGVIASFERYEYVVIAAYHQSGSHDDLQHRYESLMHYLNM
jgi:acetoin utilization protein AcuB